MFFKVFTFLLIIYTVSCQQVNEYPVEETPDDHNTTAEASSISLIVKSIPILADALTDLAKNGSLDTADKRKIKFDIPGTHEKGREKTYVRAKKDLKRKGSNYIKLDKVAQLLEERFKEVGIASKIERKELTFEHNASICREQSFGDIVIIEC